jgi:hypothetical protein
VLATPVSPEWKRNATSSCSQARMKATVRAMPPSSFRLVTMASGARRRTALGRSIKWVENEARVAARRSAISS